MICLNDCDSDDMIIPGTKVSVNVRFRNETAIVEKLDGGDYVVKFSEPIEEQCARCGLCKSALTCGEPRLIRIQSNVMIGNPKPGDKVIVHVPDTGAALSAFVTLGVPLLGGIIAITAVSLLNIGEWAAIIIGLAGFLIGWAASYSFWGRNAKPFAEVEPQIQPKL